MLFFFILAPHLQKTAVAKNYQTLSLESALFPKQRPSLAECW